MKNIIITIAGIAILIAGGWYAFSSRDSSPGSTERLGETEESSEAIAIVNGEEVSRADFEMLQAQIAAEQGFDAAALDAQMQAQLQAQVVDMLIAQVLLRQGAEQSNVTVLPADIDAQIEMIKSQFEGEAAFAEVLLAEGITEEELRSQISADLLVQAYLDQELDLSSSSATEEEIAAAYEQVPAGGDAPPLEDVRDQVAESVIQQKQQEMVTAFIDELRAGADVSILL